MKQHRIPRIINFFGKVGIIQYVYFKEESVTSYRVKFMLTDAIEVEFTKYEGLDWHLDIFTLHEYNKWLSELNPEEQWPNSTWGNEEKNHEKGGKEECK